MKDRAADDQPDGVEAGLADEQELVDAEVRRVQALAVLLQALAAGLGDPLEGGGVVVSHVDRILTVVLVGGRDRA